MQQAVINGKMALQTTIIHAHTHTEFGVRWSANYKE